jgi:hypothetical protein
MPQQPKPRIAVHAVLLELQLARPYGGDDLLLSQSKFLPGGLVAKCGSLPRTLIMLKKKAIP